MLVSNLVRVKQQGNQKKMQIQLHRIRPGDVTRTQWTDYLNEIERKNRQFEIRAKKTN